VWGWKVLRLRTWACGYVGCLPLMFPFAAILTAHSSERSPRLVEMEVIGVRGIVVGRKHGSERPAGLVARAAQEGGFRARPCPASRDADAPAVVEDEGRDVDRVAGSVLAPASFPLAVESDRKN